MEKDLNQTNRHSPTYGYWVNIYVREEQFPNAFRQAESGE